MRNAAAVKTNLSDRELRDLLEIALKEAESSKTVDLMDIYSSTSEILYKVNGANIFRRSFTVKDDTSITFGDPVEVVEEKTYVPVTASVSAKLGASSSKGRPLPDTWGIHKKSTPPDTWAMSAAEHAAKKNNPIALPPSPVPPVEVRLADKPHKAPDTWAMSAAEHAAKSTGKPHPLPDTWGLEKGKGK